MVGESTATTWGEAVGDAVGDAVDPNTEKGRRGAQGGRGHEQGATKVHNRTTGQQHNSNRRKLPNEARESSLPCASLGEADGARHWRVGEARGE